MLFTGGAEDGSWFDAEWKTDQKANDTVLRAEYCVVGQQDRWITLVPEVYRGDV
jgi:hypothetical protein